MDESGEQPTSAFGEYSDDPEVVAKMEEEVCACDTTAPHATAYWHRLWMWQTLVAAGLLTHVSHGGAVHFLA